MKAKVIMILVFAVFSFNFAVAKEYRPSLVDFYLHQFSNLSPAMEEINNGTVQNNIYYHAESKKGYTVKMPNIGFENLYPLRYKKPEVAAFIKNYPLLKDTVDSIVSFSDRASLDIVSESVKIDRKGFLVAMIISAYITDKYPSSTDSWCRSIRMVIMLSINLPKTRLPIAV